MLEYNAIQPITTSVLVSQKCTYTIVNVLAKSHHSLVYLALCTPLNSQHGYQTGSNGSDSDSQYVVLKHVMLREEAVCEVECHQLVQNHSNVLPILDYIWRDDDMFIVLEYCPNGDLFNALIRLNSNPAVTQQERERLVVPILHDILHSIRWCHANNIWHRDIKPENVLLASDGRAFLADFGLATKERQTLDRNIGSAFYMAPELLAAPYQYLGSGYVDSEKVDIWALGVLLINMLCGRNPWEKAQYHDASFQLYLQDPEVLRNSFHFSDDGWYVIRRMLSVDPCERPTIEQVINWAKHIKYWIVAPLPAIPQIESFEFDDIYAELEANAIALADYDEVAFDMIDTVPEVASDASEVYDECVYDAQLADDDTADIANVPEMVAHTSGRPKSRPSHEEQYAPLLIQVAANELMDIHSPRPQATRIPSLTNSLLSVSDDDVDLVGLSEHDMPTNEQYSLNSQSMWHTYHHQYNDAAIEQSYPPVASTATTIATASSLSQVQWYDDDFYDDDDDDEFYDDHQTIIDIYESYQTASTTASMSSAAATVPSFTSHEIATLSLTSSSSSASSSASSLSSRSCMIEQPKPVYMAQSHSVLDLMAKPVRSASTLLPPWADMKEMMASPALGLSEIERNLRGKPPASSCFTRTTESCTPFERVGTPACA